jgi:hypothetical protein
MYFLLPFVCGRATYMEVDDVVLFKNDVEFV